jgi:CubicO group peptidase (beta-lactamase class C family)
MKTCSSLILFLFFFIQLSDAQLYFPPTDSDEWDTISPISLGYCDEAIDSLYQFLDEGNTKAFILIKDGRIVLEQYFNDHKQSDNWYWASAGKSLTAVLVGIAQQEGDLSVDDISSQYLGEGWTSLTSEQERNITIKNQLSMTSGLDDSVTQSDCTDPSCLIYKADAGTRWAYHNGPYTILDQVIESASGQGLNAYVREKINIPIGMNGAYLPLGDNNVFFSTARSMARFGLLMLNKGEWDGNQILSDSDYYNDMISPSQDLNKSYGYLWWINGQESYRLPALQFDFQGSLFPNAPDDMFSALGRDGQYINVVPSQNMVWIRMGESPDNLLVPASANQEIWNLINKLNCDTVSNIHDDNSHDMIIDIHPNPVTHTLHIKVNEDMLSSKNYSIYSLTGKSFQSGRLHNQVNEIPIIDLPAGVYALRIDDMVLKFIKE